MTPLIKSEKNPNLNPVTPAMAKANRNSTKRPVSPLNSATTINESTIRSCNKIPKLNSNPISDNQNTSNNAQSLWVELGKEGYLEIINKLREITQNNIKFNIIGRSGIVKINIKTTYIDTVITFLDENKINYYGIKPKA